MNAIEVRSAYKYFGNVKDPKVVLNRLNMTVRYGSIYGLLGPSGCGKTILLSCIVGLKTFDDGSVMVLGGKPGSKKSGVPGPKVGYQPQELALVGEFTVRETIFYFAKIYGMTNEKIHERYEFLRNLLQLPDGDMYIEHCSNGQQRCVSFAASVVHEPKLLILDEPTAGLDPLLRERIWDYLVDASQNKNLTVIITTHFIEEAKQADCLGIMQGGRLLAEDSPQNVLNRFQLSSLEEAFLRLCVKHISSNFIEDHNHSQIKLYQDSAIDTETVNGKVTNDIKNLHNNNCITSNNSQNNSNSYNFDNGIHKTKAIEEDNNCLKSTFRRRISGLLMKNFVSLLRQPAALLFLVLFPLMQLFCFYFAIGANPKGLRIGIVSKELVDFNDCHNSSLITTFQHDYTCDLAKVSCRFISSLNDSVAIKEYYNTFDEAYNDTKKGYIIGFIYFASNFTESIEHRRDDGRDADDATFDNSEIQVFLDKSNQLFTFYLERKLLQTYHEFAQDLMSDCGFPIKLGNIPVNFERPIYGTEDEEFTNSFASGVIMTMVFFLATLTTSTVFISDRLEGIWNRTLVAGVSTKEILISHIITQSTIVLFQCLEIVLLSAFIFGIENSGDNLTVIVLLCLQGISGMLYGLFISVFCGSHTTANFVTTGTFFPMVILCGILWPLEGMPYLLKHFSYFLPFTLPSKAVRNILTKGWPIFEKSVLIGYGVTIAWIGVFTFLCLLFLKIKR